MRQIPTGTGMAVPVGQLARCLRTPWTTTPTVRYPVVRCRGLQAPGLPDVWSRRSVPPKAAHEQIACHRLSPGSVHGSGLTTLARELEEMRGLGRFATV